MKNNDKSKKIYFIWITELNVKSKTLGRQYGRLLSRSNAWQKFF